MQKTPVDLVAGLTAVLLCNLLFLGLTGPTPEFAIYQENGLMENVQLLLLSLCGGVLLLKYFACTEPVQRIVTAAALLLVFTFFIRECDLRLYGVSPRITYFTDADGRYLLLGPSWIALLMAFARHRQARHRVLRQLPVSRIGFLLLVSAMLLGLGILLDKGVLRIMPSRFYEELFEANGYFFLLLAALRHHRTGHTEEWRSCSGASS